MRGEGIRDEEGCVWTSKRGGWWERKEPRSVSEEPVRGEGPGRDISAVTVQGNPGHKPPGRIPTHKTRIVKAYLVNQPNHRINSQLHPNGIEIVLFLCVDGTISKSRKLDNS